MKITLEKESAGTFWSIRWDRDLEGDLVCDKMCFDEALGAVAAIMLGVRPPYLEPPDVHKKRMARFMLSSNDEGPTLDTNL